MKVLVIGKNGQLGSELIRLIPGAIGTTREDGGDLKLDITNYEEVRRVISDEAPDVVINTAAITNVDECELKPDLALKVNGLSVKSMAKACESIDAYFIHISTDYVFDGKKGNYSEYEMPLPINYYGISKLIGDVFALSNDRSLVIRTSGVFGIKMNFPLFVIKTLRENGTVKCIDSLYSPIHATMLANAIREFVEKPAYGILNISGERVSRYDLANKIKEKFKIDKGKVELLNQATKMIAKRPFDSSLNNEKAKSLLNIKFESLDANLNMINE